MKKVFAAALFGIVFFVSCTKSGSLGGGTSSGNSFGGTLNGSVSGGLSPISGASVSLYQAGNATPLTSATTSTNGSFSIAYTNPGGSSLLYLLVNGGNSGGGSNSAIQLAAALGNPSNVPASVSINELTTVVLAQLGRNFGFMRDVNGQISFSTTSQSTSTNVVNQQNNFLQGAALNTGNSAVTAGIQNIINTMASASAACIETPSNCSTFFRTAANSSGGASTNIFDSMNNMMLVSTDTTPIYNFGFPFSAGTGFSITAAPSALITQMPAMITGYNVGLNPRAMAVDASGNVWVANDSSSSITELNSSGAAVGTYSIGTVPNGVAIDANGNVWTAGSSGNALELNSSGTLVGTFAVGTSPRPILIDASGNVWVGNNGSNTVTKLSSSGSLLGTFPGPSGGAVLGLAADVNGNLWAGNSGSSNNLLELSSAGGNLAQFSIANGAANIMFDPSGNGWISNLSSSTLTKINSAGTTLGTFTVGSGPEVQAIDANGNIWAENDSGNTVSELNSSGQTFATYTGFTSPRGIAIDPSGNVLVTNAALSSVALSRINGVSVGPQFFPTQGPQFCHSY